MKMCLLKLTICYNFAEEYQYGKEKGNQMFGCVLLKACEKQLFGDVQDKTRWLKTLSCNFGIAIWTIFLLLQCILYHHDTLYQANISMG